MGDNGFKLNRQLNWFEYLAIAAGIIGLRVVITTLINKVGEVQKTKALASMPPEYWLAKKAEEEASVEKRRLNLETVERLDLDLRDRLSNPELMPWERRDLMEASSKIVLDE